MSETRTVDDFLLQLADAESRAAFRVTTGDTLLPRQSLLPRDGRVRIARKPVKGNSITPSSFRPHVLAADRLVLWTTPTTVPFQRSLESQLPQTPVLKMFQVMICSLDEGTRSNYGAGLLRFTQFCDRHSIPESSRMPASSQLLSSFAASNAGLASSSALNNWMAGLHFWHVVNGASWAGDDLLRHVRRGFAKLVPASSKRAKRPPVTIEALAVLREGLDLSNAFDAGVWAVASIAFWSCCRCVSPFSLSLSLSRLPLLSALSLLTLLSSGSASWLFLVAVPFLQANTSLAVSFPSSSTVFSRPMPSTLRSMFLGPRRLCRRARTSPSPNASPCVLSPLSSIICHVMSVFLPLPLSSLSRPPVAAGYP